MNKNNSKSPLSWNEESRNAFQTIKEALVEATTLVHPVQGSAITLTTDQPNSSIGWVLHQIVNGEKQPLNFFSRSLASIERKYSVSDPELFAIYIEIDCFKYALEDRSFTLPSWIKNL